jgi:hypothetical protein
MVKKEAHPEFRLFEYLNGNIDEKAAHAIESHLSLCDDCALVVRLVRELRNAAEAQTPQGRHRVSTTYSQTSTEHPDLSELATFFYAKSRRPKNPSVAAHVALCISCGDAIAQYARGEHAAAGYNPASVTAGEVPASSWEMIRDWEDSSFAKMKPANEVLGQELLTRLGRILKEQQGHKLVRDSTQPDSERVPVLIVSSSGDVRSVEFFERGFDATGASVLRHSEGSARFDNMPLLTLFGFGEKDSFVVSNPIRRDTIRLERVRSEEESLSADYIIIED